MNGGNEEEQVYILCQDCLIDGKEMQFFGRPSGHVCTENATPSLFQLSFVFLGLKARLFRNACAQHMLYDSSQQKSGGVVIVVSSSGQMPLAYGLSHPRILKSPNLPARRY